MRIQLATNCCSGAFASCHPGFLTSHPGNQAGQLGQPLDHNLVDGEHPQTLDILANRIMKIVRQLIYCIPIPIFVMHPQAYELSFGTHSDALGPTASRNSTPHSITVKRCSTFTDATFGSKNQPVHIAGAGIVTPIDSTYTSNFRTIADLPWLQWFPG